VNICREIGASIYLSGPSARVYLDQEEFAKSAVGLEWMDYSSYPRYPQLHGPFAHGVTVLDLILNKGPDARTFLKSALIPKMYMHANRGIVFNFLTSYRTYSDPLLYYFDPREMFDFATTHLSRFVALDASYPLHECTVTVFNKDYMAAFHGHEDLKKYFR
jgi:hypothetical protein